MVNLESNPQNSLTLHAEAPVVAFAWDPTDPDRLLIATNDGRLLLVKVEETESVRALAIISIYISLGFPYTNAIDIEN